MGITEINSIQYVSSNPVNNFISIALDKEIYFPNETVRGEVWICSPGEIYLCNIIVKVLAEEKWIFVESGDVSYSDVKTICLHEQGLIEQNNNQQINQLMLNLKAQTKFQFKFSFCLPKDLHPSFEYPFPNRTAFIRYKLTATIMGPTQLPSSSSNIIIKSRPLVLSEPLNFSSCVNVHTWGVKENGTTIMSVSFPSNNFRYKDVIPLKVTINNRRSDMETKLIKLEIAREISFFSHSGLLRHSFSKTIKKQEYSFICPRRSIKTEGLEIEFADDDENSYTWSTPYPSLKDKKGMFMGSVESTMIHCKYSIKLTCYFTSMVGYSNRPRIFAPLSMTYQLNDEFQLELKENDDMKKALFESKIEYDNIKENEKNFLIDDANDNELISNQSEKLKEIPMQLSIINDVSQEKQIVNSNNNNFLPICNNYNPLPLGNNNNYNLLPLGNNSHKGMNQPPIQNNLDQKPADFVDINAL